MDASRNHKKIPVENEEMDPGAEATAEEMDPILPPQGSAGPVEEAVAGSESPEPEGASARPERAEIDVLRKEHAELNERYVRLHAEFDNYKKRVAKDREELRKFANEGIIMELLSVIDHLEMAVKHAQGDALANVIKGVEITLKEFERVLENNGVRRIEARGQEFDPNIHHAMTQVPTGEARANTVMEEFRTGYQLHEKVIRPSLVAVATAPPEPAPESGEKESSPDDGNPTAG